jgi:hypothetical protein
MLNKPAGTVLASLRDSRTEVEGTVHFRSHLIEASGSSEAPYDSPGLFTRCGIFISSLFGNTVVSDILFCEAGSVGRRTFCLSWL